MCVYNKLYMYAQGKKMWSIQLRCNITSVSVMDHRQKGFKATVLGLEDKTVCIYKDKFLVNQFSVPDVISAIQFGRFGREEGSLIMVTKG